MDSGHAATDTDKVDAVDTDRANITQTLNREAFPKTMSFLLIFRPLMIR